jgi:hypothetical protein
MKYFLGFMMAEDDAVSVTEGISQTEQAAR